MVKIQVKKTVVKLLLVSLFLLNALTHNANGIWHQILSYTDEIISVLFLIYYLYYRYLKKYKVSAFEKKIFRAYVALLLIGVVSSLINRIQPFFPCVVDAVICSKFVAILLGSSVMWRNRRSQEGIVAEMNSVVRLYSAVIFILDIINIFAFPLFPTYGRRLPIESQALFYAGCAELAISALCAMALLLYNAKYIKGNIRYMILCSFVVITTARYKEIAVLILMWLLYFCFVVGKARLRTVIIVFGAVAVVLFGWEQFMVYYGNLDQARALMTASGVKIANDYFPLGAGFGTFGSYMSAVYYSPLYAQYGLTNVYGVSKATANYITDAFLPAVLGEFGWFGLVIMLYIFGMLFIELVHVKEKYYFVTGVSLIAYIIVGALGTTSIFSPSASFIAVIMSNIIVVNQRVLNEKH